MSEPLTAPLGLRLSIDALVANWRWLKGVSGGAACGAAVKADAYGLGAIEVTRRLATAGCRDFFVATWTEAAEMAPLMTDGASLSVLHGVRAEDMATATRIAARPVLNTAEQVQRWRSAGGGVCDVMIDTGMNRLGLSPAQVADGVLDGLTIDTLMSHLASADEDCEQNAAQCAALRALIDSERVLARRYSLANSAGICLGPDYHFDLTRPGLALYGGIPRAEAAGHIRQVVTPEAQILQIHDVKAGESVGYNATWRAAAPARIATINLGYADGYLRGFSNKGAAFFEGAHLPVVGRVSMDLVTLHVPDDCPVGEGDWVAIDYNLPRAAALSGLAQYELLTGLGRRFDRIWE